MTGLDEDGSSQVFVNGGRQHLAWRSSLTLDDQLAARSADVASAALPDRYDEPTLGKDLGESIDRRVRRALERDTRRGIQRDEIHLRPHTRQQLREVSRIFR